MHPFQGIDSHISYAKLAGYDAGSQMVTDINIRFNRARQYYYGIDMPLDVDSGAVLSMGYVYTAAPSANNFFLTRKVGTENEYGFNYLTLSAGWFSAGQEYANTLTMYNCHLIDSVLGIAQIVQGGWEVTGQISISFVRTDKDQDYWSNIEPNNNDTGQHGPSNDYTRCWYFARGS